MKRWIKRVWIELKSIEIDRKIELLFIFGGTVIAVLVLSNGLTQLEQMREQTNAMVRQLAEMQSGAADTKKAIAALERIAGATQSAIEQNKALLDATIQAARVGQRPWVVFKAIETEKRSSTDGDQVANWQFKAMWENVGSTPTKNAIARISWQAMPSVMPKDFPFPDLGDQGNVPVVLGPKAVVGSAAMKVDVSLIKAVQENKAHLYLWGWMSYRDIFENTKLHVTKFCRELAEIHGSPISGGGTTKFTFRHCPYHNCTDEECSQKTGNKPAS